eukprot:172701-Karenia_brevis.AAC.1
MVGFRNSCRLSVHGLCSSIVNCCGHFGRDFAGNRCMGSGTSCTLCLHVLCYSTATCSKRFWQNLLANDATIAVLALHARRVQLLSRSPFQR